MSEAPRRIKDIGQSIHDSPLDTVFRFQIAGIHELILHSQLLKVCIPLSYSGFHKDFIGCFFLFLQSSC